MVKKILLCLMLIFFCSLGEANYRVGFYGLPSKEISETMQEISTLVSSQKNAPPTFYTLKRRAEADLPLFIDLLHACGYFDATITLEYQGDFPNVTVCVRVAAGPLYRFAEMLVEDPNGCPISLCLPLLEMAIGSPARFDLILNTEEIIKTEMGSLGYPFSEVLSHNIIVDQKTKELFVKYIVNSGPKAYFDTITLQGLCKTRPAFVHKKIFWKKGELYNPGKIDCTYAALQESANFSLIQIVPGRMTEDGSLEMVIKLVENKYRHLGAGVSYSTDESLGAVAQWTHDNFRGMGDTFSLIAETSAIVKRSTLVYNRPDFIQRGQDLTYSFELREEKAPGFTERELSLLARLGRRLDDRLYFSYGFRYENLISSHSDNNEDYNLFSLPLHIRFDTTNRLLNQSQGISLNYWATPHKALFTSDIVFIKQELIAALFCPFDFKPEVILALCAQCGSIIGQSRILIPAPKRFYAGSSTGLRGYKYLSVSPLNGTTPIGGRSLLIFQFEPRVRIIDKLYAALFWDMGNVYSSSFPLLDEKLLRSYGGGIRYLTPVGVFRLDIGFPLDRRKGIDGPFQIYASIGQIF